MATSQSPASWSEWSIGLRVWLERAGQAVLGPGRFELLEGIERCHSISAAARQLGMSYRHAWILVQAINEAAGEPLVVAATGGRQGGGAGLTPFGRQVVEIYGEVRKQLQQDALALVPRLGQVSTPNTLHVAAAVSLDVVLGQLLADYAQQVPGLRVRAIYGASDELAEHLLAGAPLDLFVTADACQLEHLQRLGIVEPESLTHLAENSLAAVGAAGRSLRVRRSADLARSDVTRIALASPSTPLGRYARLYLQREGLYDRLRSRTLLVENSRSVLGAVRSGQADIGLIYGSDTANFPDCQLLFRVRQAPVRMRFTAAAVCRGQYPTETRRLLDFLASPWAASRFRRCGFRPVRK